MTGPLDAAAVHERLERLDGWSVVEGRLHRELQFPDFVTAFGFMARLALIAEKMNHHPDWSNSWNRVTVDIISHAAGGITEACFELASAADHLT
ncbi:MAG TPA: 4a-hydroxytetrahydrobiopterin dehydratase [Acidimicrobiales bacterium]|nr:4a-hydroxytetrahydrobiopterin dehydratase [Acidimicrobiales bacterium]